MTNLLIVNARSTTPDPGNSQAQAMAICNGRLLAAVSEQRGRAAMLPDWLVIHAETNRIVPGVVDSPLQLIRGGLPPNMDARRDGVRSLSDARSMLSVHFSERALGDQTSVRGPARKEWQ